MVTSASSVSEVDPFCREFFENPFPAHEELREAGPIARLSRYGVWAAARWEQVHAILNDWQTFCSSRGAGLTDFAKEKAWRPRSLVLETDPNAARASDGRQCATRAQCRRSSARRPPGRDRRHCRR